MQIQMHVAVFSCLASEQRGKKIGLDKLANTSITIITLTLQSDHQATTCQ